MIRFFYVFILFFFISPLAFTKNPASNNSAIELRFFSYFYMDQENDENIRNFQKLHPNIKILTENLPYDEYCSRLFATLEYGKTDADIYAVDFHIIDQLIQSGWLEDLNQKPYFAGQLKDLYDPRLLKLAAGRTDGLFALPVNIAPGCAIYLKSSFDRAKIDPEKIRSIEDLYEAGKKIAYDEDGDGKNDFWLIPHFQTIIDMVLCTEPDTIYQILNQHIILNKANLRELMEWAIKFREAGLDASAWERSTMWYRYITEGRIAYIPANAELASELQHRFGTPLFGQFRITGLPAFHKNEKPLCSLGGGAFLAIPSRIQENRKTAAYEFIRFICARQESQLYYYKMTHALPSLHSLWNNPLIMEKNSYFGGQTTGKLLLDSIQKIPQDYRQPIKGPIANILYIILDNVLEERKTVNKAIDDAQSDLNQINVIP